MKKYDFKFTAGGWRYFHVADVIGVVGVISDIAYCSGYDEARSLQEEKANARLIAKAPEMASLLNTIASLNKNAGEIGEGMLANLIDEANRILSEVCGD